MVKNHSKKTFKRKNKISRRKSSKRKHRRNKKKNKDKTKRANDYGKAGMQPQSPQVSLPAYPLKTLRRELGKFPSGDLLTESRIGHNSLDYIRGKINKSSSDTVYVLVVSNHGTMLQLRSPSYKHLDNSHFHPSGKRVSIKPLSNNIALVFNTLPGYKTRGDHYLSLEPGKRSFIYEDLILKSLSDNIENFEVLDNLFDGGGCLSEKGERLNSDLTMLNHIEYNELGQIETYPEEEVSSLISLGQGPGGVIEKTYGVLHKLQVYKSGERYSDISFDIMSSEDRQKVGLLFKFNINSNFVYYYHNLAADDFKFFPNAVTLSEILNHIEPLISSLPSKNFIITYRACRDNSSDLQRTSSREHGNSDSIDCYIKKFHPSNRSRIKETIKDLGYSNMIDFYENLEYLDYFVKLEEEGKIISFFRDLATDKGITDQWLGLAKKERRNPPPAGYRSPPPLHTPSAAPEPSVASPEPSEDDFFTGVPPVPD